MHCRTLGSLLPHSRLFQFAVSVVMCRTLAKPGEHLPEFSRTLLHLCKITAEILPRLCRDCVETLPRLGRDFASYSRLFTAKVSVGARYSQLFASNSRLFVRAILGCLPSNSRLSCAHFPVVCRDVHTILGCLPSNVRLSCACFLVVYRAHLGCRARISRLFAVRVSAVVQKK